MLNTKKIKARMVEMGLTQKDLAGSDCLNCSETSVSQKLNRIRPLTIEEADALGRKLQLSARQYYEIFFESEIA